jgi:hypothetical protein
MKHIDAVSVLGIAPGKASGAIWMSKAKMPGRELPPTESCQIDEIACMQEKITISSWIKGGSIIKNIISSIIWT